MGLLGPGGVPLPTTVDPVSELQEQPPVDVVRAIVITVMVYPHITEPNAIAVIVHYPPTVNPDLIQTALNRAAVIVQPNLERARERMLAQVAAQDPGTNNMACRGCGTTTGEHAPGCPAISEPPPDHPSWQALENQSPCPYCNSFPHRDGCPENLERARPATATGEAPPQPTAQTCNACGQPWYAGHRPDCPAIRPSA